MSSRDSDLVAIVRDLFDAWDALRRVSADRKSETLRFDSVRALIGDDDSSVLYRLKERCHLLFRGADRGASVAVGPATLFDLAVGSLFHEAMKFRENFYQRWAYAPKVRALAEAGVADAGGLLLEFEKILEASAARESEALQEVEILARQTAQQLRSVLAANGTSGVLTRFLVERAEQVQMVFGEPIEAVLRELHGSAAAGLAAAATSYLESGFFAEAAAAFRTARSRGAGELDALLSYAEGMQAYLERRFGDAVSHLAEFCDRGGATRHPAQARLAAGVLSRLGALLDGSAEPGLVEDAGRVVDRLRASGGAAAR